MTHSNAEAQLAKLATQALGRISRRLPEDERDPQVLEQVESFITSPTRVVTIPIRSDDAASAGLLLILDHLRWHAGFPVRVRFARGWHVQRESIRLGTGSTVEEVAIITCNRPQTLARTLAAYRENLRLTHRTGVRLTVYDDSSPPYSDETRKIVENASGLYAPIALRYLGPDQKIELRRKAEEALPEQSARVERWMDDLFGCRHADGRWRGSAAEQRNWALLLAGGPVVVSDDDVVPEVFDYSLTQLRSAARYACAQVAEADASSWETPSGLISRHLGVPDMEPWPIDLLGLLGLSGPGLISAAYTGHADLRTELLVDRFLQFDDASSTAFDNPELRAPRRDLPPSVNRKFRGATFLFAPTPETRFPPVAAHQGRNEDFTLAVCSALTCPDTQPREMSTTNIHHRRGPRRESPLTAHRQELEGYAIQRVLREIVEIVDAEFGVDYLELGNLPTILEILKPTLQNTVDNLVEQLRKFTDDVMIRAERHLCEIDTALETLKHPVEDHADESVLKVYGGWKNDGSRRRRDLLHRALAKLPGRVDELSDNECRELAQVLVPNGFLSSSLPANVRKELANVAPTDLHAAFSYLRPEARRLEILADNEQDDYTVAISDLQYVAMRLRTKRRQLTHFQDQLRSDAAVPRADDIKHAAALLRYQCELFVGSLIITRALTPLMKAEQELEASEHPTY